MQIHNQLIMWQQHEAEDHVATGQLTNIRKGKKIIIKIFKKSAVALLVVPDGLV